MENLDANQLWLLLAAVAIGAYLLGRVSASGGSSEEHMARQMREREEADKLFASLSPEAQLQIDEQIQGGQTIEAVKTMREAAGVDLRQAKLAVDARKRAMGAH